jgi:Domain of Unknown Function (DUF748)
MERATLPERFRVLANKFATRRSVIWAGGSILFLLLVLFVAAYLLDEPLRSRMEAELNNRLKGYAVRVERLDFHPIGLSLELENVTVSQNAHPEPAIAEIPNLSASVHWKALFFGQLVADFEIDDPTVHLDLRQFRQEAKDEVSVKEKGWQEALQTIYPLKINRFVIRNGDLTYTDQGPFRPLRITQLNFLAENIRNVESEEGSYPSPVQAEGVVFESGKINLQGNADFLAEPHIGLKVDVQLEQIALDYFKPIAERYNAALRRGVLSTSGALEIASQGTRILIKKIILDNIDADYIHKAQAAPTKKVAQKAEETARKHSNDPAFELKIDQLEVRNGQLGYVNQGANPRYRVFFTNTALQIDNFSNHLKDGVMRGRAQAKFMGSGPSQIEIAFRPETQGPDFNSIVSIENTDMRKMNDLFRAYGNFDVVAGVFSLYSELNVRQGKIEGYVKPLFQEMDVYDQRQDREKNLFRKLYEGLVGGISSLLRNEPREEVATQTTISGDIESPQVSTWETLLRLVQNAFFRAILPGFEREVSQGSDRRKPKPAA